jgi:hypothetical protein
VSTLFLVSAYLHWRFCARRPATLRVWREPARFAFAFPSQPWRSLRQILEIEDHIVIPSMMLYLFYRITGLEMSRFTPELRSRMV